MKKTLSFIAAACLFCCCLCGAALAETQDVYEELDGILDTISGLDGDVSTEQTARIIAQLEDLDFSKAEESGGLTGSMVSSMAAAAGPNSANTTSKRSFCIHLASNLS